MSFLNIQDYEQRSLESLLEAEDIISTLSNPKSYQKYSIYFDTTKIKQLIDMALSPKQITSTISIEKMSIYNESLSSSNQRLYNTTYLFPYIASEILSHELPYINDKIMPKENLGSMINMSSFQENLLGDVSITNYSGVYNENNIISDDIIDENTPIPKLNTCTSSFQFNPPDIEYNSDKEISFNASLDIFNKSGIFFVNETAIGNTNYELIDYIFNLSSNNELNTIQGGYFIKIAQSFIHYCNLNCKDNNTFLNYICFKKDIFLQIINNFNYEYYKQLIFEILITDFSSSDDDNTNSDLYKNKIINFFINSFKNISTNRNIIISIFNILIEYLDIIKNSTELILSEPLFTNIIQYINNTQFTESECNTICLFLTLLIKNYLNEFDNNQKFLSSLTKSMPKNSTMNDKNIDKTVILYLDSSNNFVNKISNIFKFGSKYYNYKNIDKICKSTILNYFETIYNFLLLTRNLIFLSNLKEINFFENSIKFFYIIKNDTFQCLFTSFLKILINENNEPWLNEMCIVNKFIEKSIKKIENKNITKKSSLFVHFAKIFEMIIMSNDTHNFLSLFVTGNKLSFIYNKYFENVINIMNKPLGNFCNTDLYLSKIDGVGHEFKGFVDEMDMNNNDKKVNIFSSNSKKDSNFEFGELFKDNLDFGDDVEGCLDYSNS